MNMVAWRTICNRRTHIVLGLLLQDSVLSQLKLSSRDSNHIP
jgi:hypothetical protein